MFSLAQMLDEINWVILLFSPLLFQLSVFSLIAKNLLLVHMQNSRQTSKNFLSETSLFAFLCYFGSSFISLFLEAEKWKKEEGKEKLSKTRNAILKSGIEIEKPRSKHEDMQNLSSRYHVIAIAETTQSHCYVSIGLLRQLATQVLSQSYVHKS